MLAQVQAKRYIMSILKRKKTKILKEIETERHEKLYKRQGSDAKCEKCLIFIERFAFIYS